MTFRLTAPKIISEGVSAQVKSLDSNVKIPQDPAKTTPAPTVASSDYPKLVHNFAFHITSSNFFISFAFLRLSKVSQSRVILSEAILLFVPV